MGSAASLVKASQGPRALPAEEVAKSMATTGAQVAGHESAKSLPKQKEVSSTAIVKRYCYMTFFSTSFTGSVSPELGAIAMGAGPITCKRCEDEDPWGCGDVTIRREEEKTLLERLEGRWVRKDGQEMAEVVGSRGQLRWSKAFQDWESCLEETGVSKVRLKMKATGQIHEGEVYLDPVQPLSRMTTRIQHWILAEKRKPSTRRTEMSFSRCSAGVRRNCSQEVRVVWDF
eukprot:symbB.v1.2.037066.t1/scaffold5373.1/size27900/2